MDFEFPRSLQEKLRAVAGSLNRFFTESTWVYRLGDLDSAIAADPALDDSDWPVLSDPTLRRDQGVTWVRCRFEVPSHCMDIPLDGSELRAVTENGGPLFAPVQAYVDGRLTLSERSWMDFKCPEAIVSASARPGQSHLVAFRFDFRDKCYWMNRFSLRIVSDRVETCARQIESIVEELTYMARYDGALPLVERGIELLEAAAVSGLAQPLLQAAEEARALFEGFRGRIKRHRVHLVGHAHIDMNWFWSMEETRGIVARDFDTMTRLMEKYPDFKFSQSQCATYEIAEDRCRDVFEKMRVFERQNRWEVTASTWVEGDLNMAQGESVVRHVLYSRQFLDGRFSKQPRVMWCPDTFGHPANLPQVLRKSGIRYYLHTRCGLGVGSRADQGFRFLEDSRQIPVYWWRGLDGNRALVANAVYNRTLDARGVLRASARMEDFGSDIAMLTYGVGDHGGGPTERDIRWVQAARTWPTMPDLYFSTADEFFSAMEAGDYPLPERRGEMNFVFDGCYTTHADVKRQNRLCEMGLLSAEKLCAIAARMGMPYPNEAFRTLWKKVLFNQFHDILDGSGVPDTYAFTSEQAGQVLTGVGEITDRVMDALAGRYGSALGMSFLLYNPTGFDRDEDVLLPYTPASPVRAVDEAGRSMSCQPTDGGVLVRVEGLPASGLKVVSLEDGEAPAERHVTERGEFYIVDTPVYEVEISRRNGQITSLYDKDLDWYVVRREEIGWRLKDGALNVLQVHMEEPTAMSGWTIGDVRTVHTLLSGAQSEVVSDGPVECRLRFTHSFGESTIRQDIVVGVHRRDIRFETEVNWREWGDFDRDAPMLRACFTPSVKNRDAVYEIPFGTLTRPADDHEYPALSWVDISDGVHGFTLLNDCKHGYRCRGNALELTLIRSGWLPDPHSDEGVHRFTYSILPHEGDWRMGGVLAAAQALNLPVIAHEARGAEPGPFCLARCEGAVLAAVKRAESGVGLVYRLYNPSGEPSHSRLEPVAAFDSAEEVDLMESPLSVPLSVLDGVIEVEIPPFGIVSLLVC